jgi:hypothetical protein
MIRLIRLRSRDFLVLSSSLGRGNGDEMARCSFENTALTNPKLIPICFIEIYEKLPLILFLVMRLSILALFILHPFA